jgi:uncharacterized protein YndB with AHSA1/START domain
MPIPNTITRTVQLGHSQQDVWTALTTLDGLTRWFGSSAEGTVAPGEDVVMHWAQYDDGQQTLAVKVVDPMTTFAYCWGISGAPADDPRRTYVEFTLEPIEDGTRLTVRESGFAQLPDAWLEQSYQGNTQGWDVELADLVAYLDAR